jgi:UDP-3-O-[3-hydroxymyristoyl] glucosamine N-acyltransferase
MTFINSNIIEQELNILANNESFQATVSNIKAGKFDREQENNDYNDRLVYTKELRNYLYNPAVLNLIFGEPELKELFFRTFGYKGQMDFTIYPKCWLRDLPLLDIGKNVYLGDNILLGTNQVTPDQKTLVVGPIKIGDNCIFNQGCTVGGKTTIGQDGVIGFEVAFGFSNKVGDRVKIGERATIGHGNRIGNDVTMGFMSKIGHFCVIEDGVTIDEMTDIPSYSLVTKEGVFPRRKKQEKPTIERKIVVVSDNQQAPQELNRAV